MVGLVIDRPHTKPTAHAASILQRLRAGSMPCDGAWPPEKVEVFQWMRTALGAARVYDAFVLREGKIAYHVAGAIVSV